MLPTLFLFLMNQKRAISSTRSINLDDSEQIENKHTHPAKNIRHQLHENVIFTNFDKTSLT